MAGGLTIEELGVVDIAEMGLLRRREDYDSLSFTEKRELAITDGVRRQNLTGFPGIYYYTDQYREGNTGGARETFELTHSDYTTGPELRQALELGTYDALLLRLNQCTVSVAGETGEVTFGTVDNVYTSELSFIRFGDEPWSGDTVTFTMASTTDSELDTTGAMAIFHLRTEPDSFEMLVHTGRTAFTYTEGVDAEDADGISKITLYGVKFGPPTPATNLYDTPTPVWEAATYVTVDEIKASLAGGGDASSFDDSLIEQAAETATSQIDNYCGRDFLTAASRRIVSTHTLFADDRRCASLPYPVAVPVSDETFYMSYNFWTYPDDRPISDSLAFFSFSTAAGWDGLADVASDDNVYLSDIVKFEGYEYYTTMCTKDGVQFELEGDVPERRFTVYMSSTTWGLRETPAPVRRAALLIATRLIRRQDSPLGVTGFGDLGAVFVRSVDPDVARLLDPYRTNVWIG